ncbi:dihydrolipoyllysine-residue acetyltransferase [Methylophilaceae bacterium]|nr:dihydrolipoyllysine-residue acetyltransferase [Methylophilaceae bacterium]MDC0553074.1 dihydrolipoyllysine-residue acetyltransferase [Methylophilaceae bacterium]|tara:strand:- start:701 stop:2017 length:1317 start_codon:yes stop_codon:yes gene_type:complete
MATEEILIPDIGNFDSVDIIEILINVGDVVASDDPMLTVESDKASMDIPAPYGGTIKEIKMSIGDKVKEGSLIALIEKAEVPEDKPKEKPVLAEEVSSKVSDVPVPTRPVPEPPQTIAPMDKPLPVAESVLVANDKVSHASPSVRKFARNLGVNLGFVKGSAPKNRIVIGDVEVYVKSELTKPRSDDMGTHFAPIAMPNIDFSQFGSVESRPLSKIKKISGANLHRNWVTAPHVTQFDDADITDLEAFRKSMKKEAEKKDVKLTLLAFLMKACVNALRAYPVFNSSISPDGESLIMKDYFNIGFACDTPDGLVVPVVKDVYKKDVLEIAYDLGDLSNKARERKLKMDDMQGGCFTISSLGGIGGTKFTPIINCPEVAILGVSRSAMQPIFNNETQAFEPRLILPLSLSYDHRVVDGADGARFTTHLRSMLSDVRRLLL